MAFNSLGDSQEELSEINVIPLVDVMLVLLILFIITAPLFTPHAFNINIPQANTTAITETSKTIAIVINAEGQFFLNEQLMTPSMLLAHLTQLAATQSPPPQLHVHADKNTAYQNVATLLEIAQKSGLTQLGLVTQGN